MTIDRLTLCPVFLITVGCSSADEAPPQMSPTSTATTMTSAPLDMARKVPVAQDMSWWINPPKLSTLDWAAWKSQCGPDEIVFPKREYTGKLLTEPLVVTKSTWPITCKFMNRNSFSEDLAVLGKEGYVAGLQTSLTYHVGTSGQGSFSVDLDSGKVRCHDQHLLTGSLSQGERTVGYGNFLWSFAFNRGVAKIYRHGFEPSSLLMLKEFRSDGKSTPSIHRVTQRGELLFSIGDTLGSFDAMTGESYWHVKFPGVQNVWAVQELESGEMWVSTDKSVEVLDRCGKPLRRMWPASRDNHAQYPLSETAYLARRDGFRAFNKGRQTATYPSCTSLVSFTENRFACLSRTRKHLEISVFDERGKRVIETKSTADWLNTLGLSETSHIDRFNPPVTLGGRLVFLVHYSTGEVFMLIWNPETDELFHRKEPSDAKFEDYGVSVPAITPNGQIVMVGNDHVHVWETNLKVLENPGPYPRGPLGSSNNMIPITK